MNARHSHRVESLPLAVQQRIDDWCDRFERAYQFGQRPRIDQFLEDLQEPEYSALLRELLPIEFEYRRQLGEDVLFEEYQARFPEHDSLVQMAFDLRERKISEKPQRQAEEESSAQGGQPHESTVPIIEKDSEKTEFYEVINFRCPERFEIIRQIGRGGMGVVYQARDRHRNEIVAIKTIRHIDSAAIYRFKREFRTLAEVSHINLVSFHELFSSAHQEWFFTMEFVDGENLREHIRRLRKADPDTSSVSSPWNPLRSIFIQLAEGIRALHAAGKLHRDIKPGNVKVTGEGRVVLLDFGLAVEMIQHEWWNSINNNIAGTIAYMSPEQAAGKECTAATDWYSFGVVLYETLTGRRPFVGAAMEILSAKQYSEPVAPQEVTRDISEDLNSLCIDLLRTDPAARPSGADILQRLKSQHSPPNVQDIETHEDPVVAPFVGRVCESTALQRAFSRLDQNRTTVVFVHGVSGVGKSTLVQHFLDGLIGREETVVLAGRCYERESVPHKAVDSIVDTLSRYLRQLPDHEVEALMPRDVSPLVCMFPVLKRVTSVNTTRHRTKPHHDQWELRQSAVVALRELLGRLGDRRRLLLYIDDLQWGDVDSATLLADLLRPPDAPILLLLACYRSNDKESSQCVQKLLQFAEKNLSTLDVNELEVDRLSCEEACKLASLLLSVGDAMKEAQAKVVAEESAGNPFFVNELVHFIRQEDEFRDGLSSGSDFKLDDMIWTRTCGLPDELRRLLQVVAVAGQPIKELQAFSVAGASPDHNVLNRLKATRLVRTIGPNHADYLETYHDRIRETILDRLSSSELKDLHYKLACTLEQSGAADPESLAIHFHAAQELQRASEYYALAASQAAKQLAFDTAVDLYHLALDLQPGSMHRDLRVDLAGALVNAGRGPEAACEYLIAAGQGTPQERLDFRRHAFMQYLISGQFDEGIQTLHTVLREVGLKLPASSPNAFLSLLLTRIRLWLRRYRYRLRDQSQIDEKDLLMIDICWSVSIGLSMIDVFRGADFQARSLLLALRAGEPSRVARGLAMEGGHCAIVGGKARRRSAKLLKMAKALAIKVEDKYALAQASLSEGIGAHLLGEWKQAQTCCEYAEHLYRKHVANALFGGELTTSRVWTLWSLIRLGELAELQRRWPALLKQAQERGDLYDVTNLSTEIMAAVKLAEDDPDCALDQLREAMGRWTTKGFHVQHHSAIVAETEILLYLGDSRGANDVLEKTWLSYRRSLLWNCQRVRGEILYLRGRVALAAAATASDAKAYLKVADRNARRLDRERMPWTSAYATLIRVGIASQRHDVSGAVRLLRTTAKQFDALDMCLHAAAAKYRLGTLLGGDEGLELNRRSKSWMTEQRISNAARITASLVPGCLD